jgi:protease I
MALATVMAEKPAEAKAATTDLSGLRVAVIATDGFERSELLDPVQALRDAHAQVEIVSLKRGAIQGYKHHDKAERVKVDKQLSEVEPGDYQAMLLPGGALNADKLRVDPAAQEFVKSFDQAKKPIAAICHAPWLLVSAKEVQGRTLTSYYTIQDDIVNAGGRWVDQEVVVDGNWVTSRQPDDIPAFNDAMLSLFAQSRRKA